MAYISSISTRKEKEQIKTCQRQKVWYTKTPLREIMIFKLRKPRNSKQSKALSYTLKHTHPRPGGPVYSFLAGEITLQQHADHVNDQRTKYGYGRLSASSFSRLLKAHNPDRLSQTLKSTRPRPGGPIYSFLADFTSKEQYEKRMN